MLSLTNHNKLDVELIYLVCCLQTHTIEDTSYQNVYSKIFFVAGNSSLGGKENYAKTFNNQNSENFKFQLAIKYTEVQRENKENRFEDKDQTDIPDPEQFYKVGKQL